MDADTVLPAPELQCDACGYSRRGLDATARCPECGEAAPQIYSGNDAATLGSLFDDPLRSPAELLWLRMTAVGLSVLLAFWLSGLQVSLIMPIGSFALGALNFAGPKLNLAETVQRSVGRQPGEWGVIGCVAAFMQAVAIWLMTSSRFVDGGHESIWNIRTITRWVAVLAVGACLGLVLSNDADLLMPQSNETGGLLLWAILLGELPANTLLYLYLLRLARTLHNRRAITIFRWCVWMVPALSVGGALLVTVDIRRASAPEPFYYLLAAGYGVAAFGAAAAALSGIVLLLGTTAVAGFGRPFAATLVGLRTLPRYLRAATRLVVQHAAQLTVILGLLLWVGTVQYNLKSVLWAPTRLSTLGNLPALNFLGPKVIAPLLNDNRYDRYYVGNEPIFEAPVLPVAGGSVVDDRAARLDRPPANVTPARAAGQRRGRRHVTRRAAGAVVERKRHFTGDRVRRHLL